MTPVADDEDPRQRFRSRRSRRRCSRRRVRSRPGLRPSIQSKNPKIKKPIAPPIFNQSDVLNLLKSTSASVERSNSAHAHRTPCTSARTVRCPGVAYCPKHAHCAALRLRQDRHRRARQAACTNSAGKWSAAAARPRRFPPPEPRSPISPSSPACRRSSIIESSHCTRRSTAVCWPIRPSHNTASTWPEYGIEPIDLLVCNLYPFASDPSIELIDIGGPAMVRAAAKNHQFVARRRRSGRLRRRARRTPHRRDRSSADHEATPRGARVRSDRRVRRADRHMVRRRGPSRGACISR